METVLQQIQWVYQQDFKDEEGNQAPCVDNAISTLGKCVMYQGQSVSAEVATQGFFAKLPVTTDTEEA